MSELAGTFQHAVASVEPTTSGVLLWTRLTGRTEVDWVLARDPDLEDVVARGQAATSAERDHTVVVDVAGLEAATSYWYRFRIRRLARIAARSVPGLRPPVWSQVCCGGAAADCCGARPHQRR